MSCNAWNHRPDCTCGWGGVFYGAGYREGADDSWHWQRSTSYTTPNAHCPKCNARVFFYRSPYGGSVYFDDLGPPWPKHPCMDLGRTPEVRLRQHTAGATGGQQTRLGVREKGWRPLICDEVHRHERCAEVVVLKVQSGPGGTRTLYTIFDRRLLDHRTPFVARRAGDGSIEISTLNTQIAVPGEVRLIAYESTKKLPQPWRDKVNGGQTSKATHPPVSLKQREETQTASTKKATKTPRPEPAKAQVTYKHQRPDRVTLKLKQPALVEHTPEPINRPLTESHQGSKQKPKPAAHSRRYRSFDVLQPMTNMALAFQKLAETSPEVENLVIRRFRGRTQSS